MLLGWILVGTWWFSKLEGILLADGHSNSFTFFAMFMCIWYLCFLPTSVIFLPRFHSWSNPESHCCLSMHTEGSRCSFMSICSSSAARLSCAPSLPVSLPYLHPLHFPIFMPAPCPQLCPDKAVCLAWPNEVEGKVSFNSDHSPWLYTGGVTQNGEEESGGGNKWQDIMERWRLTSSTSVSTVRDYGQTRSHWRSLR